MSRTKIGMLALVVFAGGVAQAEVVTTSGPHSYSWSEPDAVDFYKLATEDGSAESSIGFGSVGTLAYANKFAIAPGGETITHINLVWGADAANVPHTFAIWQSSGLLSSMGLASSPVTVSGGSAGSTSSIDIPDATFNVGDIVYIGFVAEGGPTSYFGAWDNSAPHGGASYIWGTGSTGAFTAANIGAAAVAGEIGGFGLAGDWTIRANAVPAPGGLLVLTGALGAAVRRRR